MPRTDTERAGWEFTMRGTGDAEVVKQALEGCVTLLHLEEAVDVTHAELLHGPTWNRVPEKIRPAAPAEPVEEGAPVGVPFASDEAAEEALRLGLDAAAFESRTPSGKGGYTVDDVRKAHSDAQSDA